MQPPVSHRDGKLNVVDTVSTGQVAELLGVSIPTVRRAAIRTGLIPIHTPGGHQRFTQRHVDGLTRELGAVPAVPGRTRTEVQVMAALSRSPLGLRSARAVARAASVSPTAAARALQALHDAGLVDRTSRTLAEGRAAEGAIWEIRPMSRWREVAPLIATTVLPARDQIPPPTTLPRRLWHLFWNADPAALDLTNDADFIATRLVLGDDLQGLAWACSHLPTAALRRAAANRGADARTRSMIENVVSAA